MRIKFSLSSNTLKEINLPANYNYLIQSMIYNNLDPEVSEKLHNEGFMLNGKHFRLFTFSLLSSHKYSFNRDTKTISFKLPISLQVGILDKQICNSFLSYVLNTDKITIGENQLQISNLSIINSDELTKGIESPKLIKMVSPVTIYETLYTDGRKITNYLDPFNSKFETAVIENLQRKAKAYFGSTFPLNETVFFHPVRVNENDKVITTFKNTVIIGWLGIYELSLPTYLWRIAFDSGLGSKNSQGFGMFDIIT